jgi:5-methylcytosine-specific restriction endonuclease McrA
MVKRAYIKLNVRILDDRRIMTLSDKDFREYITSLFKNPNNLHYEGASPERLGWLLVRKKMKELVFMRDIHECKYCGSTENLEIDHIIPLAKGGTNELDNLQILCKKCNRKKGVN